MATIERNKAEVAAGTSPDRLYYEEPPASYEESPTGMGWVLFSTIVLAFAGVWAIIEGILAVSSSKIYVGDATFVFSDLNTWGWIVMGLGILTVVAAFAVSTGSELARWFGIGVAGLNAFGQLMFLYANPWWAAAMFAVDILVIYGLAVYGGSRLRTR